MRGNALDHNPMPNGGCIVLLLVSLDEGMKIILEQMCCAQSTCIQTEEYKLKNMRGMHTSYGVYMQEKYHCLCYSYSQCSATQIKIPLLAMDVWHL